MTDLPGQLLDRHQLKHLLRVALKLDWRGAVNPFAALKTRKSKIPPFAVIIVMNLLYSLIIGAIMAMYPDPFVGLVVGASLAMALVGLQVLLDYGAILIAPDDYAVIAPHPVNAKTHFCAKVVHLLIYVAILSLSLSFFSGLICTIVRRDVMVILEVLLLFLVVNIFAAFVMINLYTMAVKVTNRHRIERVLGYVQMIFATVFYALFILANQIQQFKPAMDFLQGPWLACLPPYWFAAWLKLGQTGWDSTTFFLGLGSIVALAGVVWLGVSRMSLSYATQITVLSGGRSVSRTRRRRSAGVQRLWQAINNPEELAVMTLVWAQFKHDVKFRMNILVVIPVAILVFFVYGGRGVSFVDPFSPGPREIEAGYLGLFMMLAWLPITFQTSTQYSSSFRASWVFLTAPVDRVRLVLATKKIVTILFILPFCLIAGAFFGYVFDHIIHGLLYGLFLFCLTMMTMTIANMVISGAPFAKEMPRSEVSMIYGVLFVIVGIVYAIPGIYYAKHGFGGYLTYSITLAVIVLANFSLTRIQNKRIARSARAWEYLA